MIVTNEIPISHRELAYSINRSPSYVSAMKSAGYVFSHGTRTLLSDALNWLSEHRDFRVTGYRRDLPGYYKDQARSESAKLRWRRRQKKDI
jgi:hypothetical protein